MSLRAQAAVLRALESGRIRRLGGETEIPVDLRLIAATKQDLEAAKAEGRFREDLYYRLEVIRIELPPLRERPEDLTALADHFKESRDAHDRRFLENALRAHGYRVPESADELGIHRDTLWNLARRLGIDMP